MSPKAGDLEAVRILADPETISIDVEEVEVRIECADTHMDARCSGRGDDRERASCSSQDRSPEQHSVRAMGRSTFRRSRQGGFPFVLRIHNDPGYVCPPHTHPNDENIVVVKGTWSVGMGPRINLATVQSIELGGYTVVPAKMAHFCRSKTETIIQVHGVGPFTIDMVDPLFELTAKGVNRTMSLGAPEQIVRDYPVTCFELKVGDRVTGAAGQGTVVGAQCSASNGFTRTGCRRVAAIVSGPP